MVRPDRKQFEAVRYQDAKIIIEQAAHSSGSRLLIGFISLLGLTLGFKGCYEFMMLLLGFGDGTENIPLGLLITLAFLIIPGFCLWMALNSGRTLILDPKMKYAYLTKRYPFRTVQKRFPFYELKPCTIYKDSEMDRFWHIRLSLPDRTLIEFSQTVEFSDLFGSKALEQKTLPEIWRDRINEMIHG